MTPNRLEVRVGDLLRAAAAVVEWDRLGRPQIGSAELFAGLAAAVREGVVAEARVGGLPDWARSARDADPQELAQVVTALVDAIAYPAVDRAKGGRGRRGEWAGRGDAAAVLALWRGLGGVPIGEFAEDVQVVALAARNSGHPLFARDIRGIGWGAGAAAADRSRSVATLLRQDRWSERLAAAQRWRAHVGAEWREAVLGEEPAAPPVADDLELLRKFGGGGR